MEINNRDSDSSMPSLRKTLLCFSLPLLTTTSSAFAADTAELSVIGRIPPAACTPTLTGGGVVDYGVIPVSSLSHTSATFLEKKNIAFSITCDNAISVGYSFSDNRSGTEIIGSETNLLWANYSRFGLGLDSSGNKIGAYTIGTDSNILGDDVPVNPIYRDGATGSWVAGIRDQKNDGDITASFAPNSSTAPGAYAVVSGTLIISVAIDAISSLDLKEEINLDGLATMTVHYL